MTARALAHRLLQKAETNDQYLNIALDQALLKSELSEADRRLVSILVYGVTERRLTLDYQISRLSHRAPTELDMPTLTALRMGLYQLLYLDRIPTHAAVNETVSLVPRKASGFVNAILRACTRDRRVLLPERTDLLGYLSVAYSVGEPLCRALLEAYGEERTQSILEGFDRVPPTTVSVNTLKISREELAQKLGGAPKTELAATGLRVSGAIRELYGFEEGLFFVQDEASQLCVEALDAREGETVMDLCACPGSKSFGTAIRMKNKGRVLSYDLHANKLSLIEQGAARLGISILKTDAHDARQLLPRWEEQADRVLCDVPCSGFGVLSKKPELRYKDPKRSEGLPDIQQAILETACRYVKAGGTLVYSTCTILPGENEETVTRFLQSHPEFTLTPFRVGEREIGEGMLTLLPDRYPTDGFFIAKLTKTGQAG